MALAQDVVRRLTVIASDTGLTTLKTKLDAVDQAQARVALSSTRMGSATEAAERRIQAITAQGAGLLGGFAGRAATDALVTIGKFAPAILAGYAAFKLFNVTIEQGLALLEKYGIAGQRALFGEGVDEGLKKLTRLQPDDKISVQQINTATELSDRLDKAKQIIGDFLKIQLDLTDAALKLMNVWVLLNEQLAKAAQLAGKIPTPALSIGGNAVLGALIPGYSLARNAINYLSPDEPAPTGEQAFDLAKKRLAAGMGGGFVGRFNQSIMDLANPPKPDKDAAETSVAFDRLEKSLQRQAAAQEAESQAVGASVGEHARLRTEYRLQEAAMQDIAKNGGSMDDYADRIKTISDRIAVATQNAAQLKLQSDLGFERSQLGRDPTEAGIAARLRPIYGDDYVNQMNGSIAATMRLNEQLKQTKELAIDITSGGLKDFKNALLNGASAWDAFRQAAANALNKIADKLIDMATQNLWANAFGGSGGIGSFLGGLFGSSSGGAAATGAGSSAAGGLSAIGAGVAHAGAIVGVTPSPTRYIHPAYFDDAPRFAMGLDARAPGINEIPVLAHRGEMIGWPEQMQRAFGGGVNIALNVNVDASGGGDDPDALAKTVLASFKTPAFEAQVHTAMRKANRSRVKL